MQADTVSGVTVVMGGQAERPGSPPARPRGSGSGWTDVQSGDVNVASGSDVVGVQVGQVHGRTDDPMAKFTVRELDDAIGRETADRDRAVAMGNNTAAEIYERSIANLGRYRDARQQADARVTPSNSVGKDGEHDLSTREGRAKAAASADITTPAGRALVMKVQRANEDAMSPSAGEMARNAAVMHGTGERPSERERYRDPAMRRLLGLETPEGRERFDRLTRERESGYTGPLDQDGCRPDLSVPANQRDADILHRLQQL